MLGRVAAGRKGVVQVIEQRHVEARDDVHGRIEVSLFDGGPVGVGHVGLELDEGRHVPIAAVGQHVHVGLLLAAGEDHPFVVGSRAGAPGEIRTEVFFESHNAGHLVHEPFDRFERAPDPHAHQSGAQDERRQGLRYRVVVRHEPVHRHPPVGRRHDHRVRPAVPGVLREGGGLRRGPEPRARDEQRPLVHDAGGKGRHLGDLRLGDQRIETVPRGEQHRPRSGFDTEIDEPAQPVVIDAVIFEKGGVD